MVPFMCGAGRPLPFIDILCPADNLPFFIFSWASGVALAAILACLSFSDHLVPFFLPPAPGRFIPFVPLGLPFLSLLIFSLVAFENLIPDTPSPPNVKFVNFPFLSIILPNFVINFPSNLNASFSEISFFSYLIITS